MFETFKKEGSNESFKGRGNFGPRPAGVSMGKKGVFTINPSAYEMMGKPKFVQLMFDAAAKRVGFHVVEKPTDDSYDVKVFPNGVQHRINSRKFAKHYKIKPSNRKPFELEREGDYYTFKVDTD